MTKKKLNRAEFNMCKYCNRILLGLNVCECQERMENHKLWENQIPRNSNKSRKCNS